MKHYVGIDVGGTRLKAGLVDDKHRITGEHVIALTDADKSEAGIVARLEQITRAVAGNTKPLLVGLGLAGVIDRKKGTVTTSPNFPQWADFAVKARLEERLNLPVIMDNDANCVIAGEFLRGSCAHASSVLGLTLGTGVGGALILDRRLWHGVDGMAGELGHITVDPNGPRCNCGSTGCLEVYASQIGLRLLAERRPVPGVDHTSTDLPRQLAGAAEAGDPVATEHFRTAGRALGRVLGGLLNALNIKTVCIAGGVAAALPWMEDACWQELRRVAFPAVVAGVEIVPATLGERAGILGAALQWTLLPHD